MKSKLCSQCTQDLEIEMFNKKRVKKDGAIEYQSLCKNCNSQYQKQHYLNNKPYYKKKSAEYDFNSIRSNQKKVFDYLIEHPCVDCGQNNVLTLEFDHRDPSEKIGDIANMIGRIKNNWETIFNEIKKCDVRCANCHKIKTAKSNNHLRYTFFINQTS